jgi:endonuclease/exonuclease/phosphatase family metal-dependent hydrolase
MKKIYILALLCSVVSLVYSQQRELTLQVATYNLRMDTKDDSLNAWSYRKDKVKALIRYHDWDIFGTQEGFLHQLQGICELPEYTYFGAGRDDGINAGEHSAIFYKKDCFEILESGNFWLSETPDMPGKGWDATCCNRICSWVKFKEIKTGKTFYFFNVHFDHEGKIARIESGKLMVKKIREIAKDNPVISTGDFNSTSETEQIQLLSTYLNDSKQVTQLPPYGPDGTFTTRFVNPIHAGRIDYIFVSNGIQVLKYATLTDNDGQYYPSDHIPVAAEVEIK